MKIAWEVLQEEYENNDNLIIGHIDCDVESKLCESFDVIGTPTLLYGHRLNLNEYTGDTDFANLKKWTKESLLDPVCSPEYLDGCSDEDRKRIEKWVVLSEDEIKDMIQKVEDDEKSIDIEFDKGMEELQKVYDEINNAHVIVLASIRREIDVLKRIVDER